MSARPEISENKERNARLRGQPIGVFCSPRHIPTGRCAEEPVDWRTPLRASPTR